MVGHIVTRIALLYDCVKASRRGDLQNKKPAATRESMDVGVPPCDPAEGGSGAVGGGSRSKRRKNRTRRQKGRSTATRETEQSTATREREQSTATREREQSSAPDYSLLPAVVWDDILLKLKGRCRIAVSDTCRRLRILCQRSILWKHLDITLSAPYRDCGADEFDNVGRRLLRCCSPYATKLHLDFCHCAPCVDLSDAFFQFMHDCSRRWCVDQLKLFLTSGQYDEGRLYHYWTVLMSILLDEPQLNTLQELTVYCDMRCYKVGRRIFYQLSLIHTLRESLKILNLFSYNDPPHRLEYEDVEPFVSNLFALQNLTLHSEFLTDELLDALMEVRELQCFNIRYDLSWAPETSEDRWSDLASRHPNMVVEVDLVSSIMEWADFSLPPGAAPIRTFRIVYRHELKDETEDWLYILLLYLQRYANTLSNLQVFVTNQLMRAEEELIALASMCQQLQHITVRGIVREETIIRLSKLEREWKTFRFGLLDSKFRPRARDKDFQLLCDKVKTSCALELRAPPVVIPDSHRLYRIGNKRYSKPGYLFIAWVEFL